MRDPCRFVVWPHHTDVLRRPATNGKDAGVPGRGLSLSDAVAADNAIETDRAMGHAGV